VGIGFGATRIGDLSGLDRSGIQARVQDNEPDASRNKIGATVGQIERFLNEIRVDDYVLTPVPGRNVLIGKVTSNYRYDPTSTGKPHRRSVEWRSTVSRDDLSVPLKNALGGLMTVFRVTGHADEISRLLGGEQEPPTVEPISDTDESDNTDIEYAENVEAAARERIEDLVLGQGRFDGHEFEWFVAALLRAMGFKIIREPQPGRDGGVDIIAAPDAFGFQEPRIVVQVKHHRGSVGEPEVAQLRGVLRAQEKGLFVSTGGFTAAAQHLASPNLTLLDGKKIVSYFIEHYENMPSEYKAKVPLKRVYLPVPPDELAG